MNRCTDRWKKHIPPEKLAIYKAMIEKGYIREIHVIYNRRTGSTTVEYSAIAPHEWILARKRTMS